MKRTISPEKQKETAVAYAKLQLLSTLTRRANLAYLAGLQTFDGSRDMNEALGYPTDITFKDYLGRYYRQDVANAIINRPVSACWRGPVTLLEAGFKEDTALEKAWVTLDKTLKLKPKLVQLDKLASIGQYAVLLLGLSDVKKQTDFENPVTSSNLKLAYIKPYSEEYAKINSYETNVSSPRFGLPKNYRITTQAADSNLQATALVDWTRVIHVAYDTLESEVEGSSALEPVFNRLIDIEKVIGGGGEMFWRGARPGYAGKLDDKHFMTKKLYDDLMDQLDEYEHNLRRFLISEGVDINSLAPQVSDPSMHIDVNIQMISAKTGIPKRILTGSERGELASSLDADEWKSFILSRREECVEPLILRPFVDSCIKYGVLPTPKDVESGYSVKWTELFSLSEKDRAEVGKTRALALQAYLSSPMAEAVVSPEAFFNMFLGLSDDQIEMMVEMRGGPMSEELRAQREAEEEQQRIDQAARLAETQGQEVSAGGDDEEDETEQELKRTR